MLRLDSKKVFDPTTLEIILAPFVVETCCFFSVICLQWKFMTNLFFIFEEVLNLGAWKLALF